MSNAVPAPSSSFSGVPAFATAVCALFLAFCAAFFAPMLAAEMVPDYADSLAAIFYVLPVPIGLIAAWLGGRSLTGGPTTSETAGGGLGFFAMLVGLLAAISGAVLVYARLIEGSPL